MNANAVAGTSTAPAPSTKRRRGLTPRPASPAASRGSRDSITSERPLSLSRIHRLLRPLRAAAQRLGQPPSLAGSAPSSRSASVSSRPLTFGKSRFGSRDSDDSDDGDWRASRGKEGSSPFGRRRKRVGRATKQYGSKAIMTGPRDHGVGRYQEPLAGAASFAEILDRYHRYSAGDQPADAFLRAYSNILEAVYSGASRKGKLSSLVESSARQIGATLETELQACLAIVSSSEGESELETAAADHVQAPGMERTASAQEAELEAAGLQDEWYEACPQAAWRWLLAEHATAIAVEALTSHSTLEACFSICLLHGAEVEASRFYTPLVSTALYGSDTTPRPHILNLLRSCPSPLRLVDSALVPTLLDSAFADRLFYHQYLAIAPVSSRLRDEDALPTARLAVGLLHVAAQMIRSVAGQVAASDEPDHLDRIIDEIMDRLVAQIRHCAVLWMRAKQTTCLDAVRDAFDEIRNALEPAVDVDLFAGSQAFGRLFSYALVLDTTHLADGSTARLDDWYDRLLATAAVDADDPSSRDTVTDTLRGSFSTCFCPAHSLDQAFAVCDLLSRCRHGSAIGATLLGAYTLRKGLSHDDRDRLAERLSTLGPASAPRVGTSGSPEVDGSNAPAPSAAISLDSEDATDYDEPFPLRRPAKRAKKRLFIVVTSDSDSRSDCASSDSVSSSRAVSPAAAPTRHARRVDVSYLNPLHDPADSSDSLDLLQSARRGRPRELPRGRPDLERALSRERASSPERTSSPERAFSELRPLSFSDAPPSPSPSPTPPVDKAPPIATTRPPKATKQESRPGPITIPAELRRRLSPRKVSLGRLAERRKAFAYPGDASSSEDELLLA